MKKLLFALAITIITTLSLTGCDGNESNPNGEAVASENSISGDAVVSVDETASEDEVISTDELSQESDSNSQTSVIATPEVVFIPWEEAGLEDHVMDWQDEKLEAAMREITGIAEGDIMLSDVWEITVLELSE